MNNSFPPIADLLPHDPPMILLDNLLNFSDTSVHTCVTIREHSPFCSKGQVPAYVALEYMAQCAGAWSGMMARLTHMPPKTGFLLGTRKLTLHRDSFKVGETLNVYGETQFNDGEMAYFECKIVVEGQIAASAGINVYQPRTNLSEEVTSQ